MKQTFSIKENRDFRRLYYRGQSIGTPFLVLYVMKNRKKYNRIGITVSTKLGTAVVRNRAKRLLREAYRLQEGNLAYGYDFVLVARGRLTSAKLKDAEKAFKKAAKNLGVLREEAPK